jgi:hypothetical protein
VQLGQDPELFWRVTLRTYATVAQAVQRKLVDEHNYRMNLAWHIVALQKQRKLPKLTSMMKSYPRTRPQTKEEMRRIVRMMVETCKGN